MKTKVEAIKVARPDGCGFNWIVIRTREGDLKRRFVEKLLLDGVVVPQSAAVALLQEVLAENKRLRKEVRVQNQRVKIRDEILEENGIAYF